MVERCSRVGAPVWAPFSTSQQKFIAPCFCPSILGTKQGDLMSQTKDFSAEDIAKATNGWIDNKRLQNWASRGLWLTPTVAPSPGKAKRYSRANLCEAVIASDLRKYGFKDEAARAVIKSRLRSAFVKPAGNGFASEYIARFGELPELRGKLRYWVIAMSPSDDHWGQVANVVIGCKSGADLPAKLDTMPYAVVFDVAKALSDAFANLDEVAS
jgi:hypothetical protein